MTTQIMVMAHADPAAVIGGKLPLIDAYGRYGTGREIVVEACEYSNTFLHLVPYISVLLNVDADHLEFFKTMENLEESFRKFALLTTHTVIANLDDANTVKVIHNLDRHIRTIGIDTPADYRAVHVREYRPSFFCFDVQVLGVPQCTLNFRCPDATMCTSAGRFRMRHDVRLHGRRVRPGASTHSGAPAAALSFWER